MDHIELPEEIFNKRAREYCEKFMDTSLYHETFNLFCDAIKKPDANILELACGPGNITAYLLSKRRDFRILATDLAPNMLELAQTNAPAARFQLMDCRNIKIITEKFDGVMCGFVLPYLSPKEAEKLIDDIAALLCQGGVLYISTMEGGHEMSGVQTNSYGDQVYMYYHEAGNLVERLKRHFNEVHIQRLNCPDANGVLSTDLILIATGKK